MKDFNLDLDLGLNDLGLNDLVLTENQSKLDDLGLLDLDFEMDLNGFDLDFEKTTTENRYILPKLFKERVPEYRVKFDNAELLIKEFGQNILNGERVNAVLSGNFIFGDFFEAFVYETETAIDELQISTLSMSEDNIESFSSLIDGGLLDKLDIIISDYWWSHNRANAPYIYEKLDIDNKFQFAVAGTHTKIALMKIGERKIVISGSANLRSSRSVEEIQIETNPDLYDFHHEWQSKILSNYGMIKKAVRASALFDMITKGIDADKAAKQKKAFRG